MRLLVAALLQASAAPSAAAGPADASDAASAAVPLVEIRVMGDEATLARVRASASELFARLNVRLNVIADGGDPPAVADENPPLVLAYIDLRVPTAPMVDVDDGRTRQELMRRRLADVSSLETGVEAAVHVVYASVEALLQLAVERREAAKPVAPLSAPPAPLAPPPPASLSSPPALDAPAATSPGARSDRGAGLDFGAAFRLVALGDARLVPGAGVAVDTRVDVGPLQAELALLGVMHTTSQLDFEDGNARVRPYALRLLPGVSVHLSQQLLGTLGIGVGLDHFVLDARTAPTGGTGFDQSVTDPVLASQLGLRFPIGGAWFASVLGTLDVDLEPTSFVIGRGDATQPLLSLPRLRGGVLLIASLSATHVPRFEAAKEER